MSLGLLLVLVPLLAVAGVVVLVSVLLAAVPSRALPAPTALARRHAVVGGTSAVVAAVLAAVVTAAAGLLQLVPPPWQVAVTVLAPASAGAAHSAVLLLTELTWPRPEGTVRSALVARRSVREIVPRRLSVALVLLVLLLVAGVVSAGLLADDRDPLSISRSTALTSSSAGPFPGWPAGLPALAGIAVVLLLTAMVLQRAVTRPAVAEADAVTDRALRRASAHRAVRGAVAATALTLGPLLLAGAGVARNVAPAGANVPLLVAALAGLLVALAGCAVLCVPAPAVPPAAPDGEPAGAYADAGPS